MRKLLIFGLALAILGASSCEKEKTVSPSMKQIHEDKGIPVKVETISPKRFTTHLSYYSSLSGVEESSAFANLTDKVEGLHVRIGDYVKKGKLIVSFPEDNIAAKYRQTELAYDNAKASFDRVSKLKRSGVISDQTYDNAKNQFDLAAANLTSARKMIRVTAPISGHITRINISDSENVAPGKELFVVSRIDKIKGTIWISDKMIHLIKEGLPATASWNGTVLKGKVVRVDRGINPQHQAFGAIVEFDNPKRHLVTGVTAEIKVETYHNEKAVVLEKQHLIDEQAQQFVYLAASGRALKRPVKVGNRQGILVEILEGLDKDERLIVSGHTMVKDGAKINVLN